MIPDGKKQDYSELLVVAMARPTMVKGMSLASVSFSIIVPSVIACIFRQELFFLAIPLALGVSYLVCLKDVFLFDIFLGWTNLMTCRNRKLWGYRSYAPR